MHPIKRERAKRRWPLRELARRSSVPAGTISGIERGQREPQMLTLAKIADAFEVDIEDLYPPKAPSSSPVAPDAQAREELNTETLRRELQEHSDALEHVLQPWEEAAARLRERRVPYHDHWGLTIAYAASSLWKNLERKNVLDELQPQGAFAEALATVEDLPDPLRQEVTRLYDAIGRLTRISSIAMEAERIALEDRDSGSVADVVNLPQWEARAKRLPPRPETARGAESA